MKQITIGMFGFGNVGHGLYDVLEKIQSKNVRIKTICIKHPEKDRGVE